MGAYGVTSLKDIAAETSVPYDYLLCMLYELKCKKKTEAFYYNQLDITYLPMEVVTLLWPEDTVAKVTRLFWQLYIRVENMEEEGVSGQDCEITVWPCEYPQQRWMSWPDFAECWLFKIMLLWADDETVELKDRAKIKKTLFEVTFSKQSNWLD